MRVAAHFALVVGISVCSASAQQVVSARSGLIHYVEGQVELDGKQVEYKPALFPDMKDGSELKTHDGRVEVLLTPGVFLRVAENSTVRMVSNKLAATRVEFLSGSVLVESADSLKENSVTLSYKGADVRLRRDGLYRLDSEPSALKVYSGEALVETADQSVTVKDGKRLPFGGVFAAERFNSKAGDAFYRWTKRRAEYISTANISAAKSIYDSDSGWRSNGWAWNPYYSMFTYVPYRGSYNSPYGYRYWSPVAVYQIYAPRPVFQNSGGGFNPGVGYSTNRQTSSGYSGTVAAAAPAHSASTTAAAAPSAPVSRESGQAGGRSR